MSCLFRRCPIPFPTAHSLFIGRNGYKGHASCTTMSGFEIFSKGEVLGEPSTPVASLQESKETPEPVQEPEVPEAPDGRTRVLFCGTYPIGQSNGYSRVVYYIAKYLGLKEDIKLTIYGFQNYQQTAGSSIRNDISKSVKLHDALATEDPKRQGFGEKEIGTFLKSNPQDIVIIFNDMVITSLLAQTIVTELTPEERGRFKLVSYMDQVYPYQKKQYMTILNSVFDAVVAFTPYWEQTVRELGLRPEIPTFHFPHGFDHQLYYPIPRAIARRFLQLPLDAFIVLNLNRNQPRKRWDHTLMAWADVVQRHISLGPNAQARPPRLMIGAQVDGIWNLNDIFENELRRRKIPIEVGKKYLLMVSKPQQMSDRDINILYNACDIGINTCEGEGFGLCQFEHSAVRCPQVAPKIGGFREFLHENNSILVEPKWNYYIDKQRDGIGGMAEVGDPVDYANGIWKYYTNPKLVIKHGTRARREILQHYRWATMVDHFHKIIKHITSLPSTGKP